MRLALNLGNTRLQGAFFEGREIRARFDAPTATLDDAHAARAALETALAQAGLEASRVERVGASSVVPKRWPFVHEASRALFGAEPAQVSAASPTGLKIAYARPETLGADRLAAAVACAELCPRQNALIADFGTATTYTALSSDGTILGGLISAGAALSLQALARGTGQLPELAAAAPARLIADSTEEALRSGAYFTQLFALGGIVERVRRETFRGGPMKLVATGGGAPALAADARFDLLEPDLVLRGVRRVLELSGSN